jgi:transcriptional regulator with XRE-family HTH domain
MKEAELSFSREVEDKLSELETNPTFVAESLKFKFGDEIIRILKERGWSRSDLARAMGRSRQYVTRMLRGDTNFTLDSIAVLSIALKKDFNFVLADKGAAIRWLGVIEGGQEPTDKERDGWPVPTSTPAYYVASEEPGENLLGPPTDVSDKQAHGA